MKTSKYCLLSLVALTTGLNAQDVMPAEITLTCPIYSEGQGVAITPEQALESLPYAQMSYNAFRYKPSDCTVLGYRLATKEEIPAELQKFYNPKAQRLEDSHTGMIAREYIKEDGSQRVLAFAGSELRFWEPRNMQRFLYNMMSNSAQVLGYEPQVYAQAAQWTNIIKQDNNDQVEVVVTGSSMGGGLAQYAALLAQVRGVCFNASGISAGLKKLLENDDVKDILTAKSYELITHINIKGDWISSYTPGEQLGVRYVVPSYSESLWGFGFGSDNRHDASTIVKSLEQYGAQQ